VSGADQTLGEDGGGDDEDEEETQLVRGQGGLARNLRAPDLAKKYREMIWIRGTGSKIRTKAKSQRPQPFREEAIHVM